MLIASPPVYCEEDSPKAPTDSAKETLRSALGSPLGPVVKSPGCNVFKSASDPPFRDTYTSTFCINPPFSVSCSSMVAENTEFAGS